MFYLTRYYTIPLDIHLISRLPSALPHSHSTNSLYPVISWSLNDFLLVQYLLYIYFVYLDYSSYHVIANEPFLSQGHQHTNQTSFSFCLLLNPTNFYLTDHKTHLPILIMQLSHHHNQKHPEFFLLFQLLTQIRLHHVHTQSF